MSLLITKPMRSDAITRSMYHERFFTGTGPKIDDFKNISQNIILKCVVFRIIKHKLCAFKGPLISLRVNCLAKLWKEEIGPFFRK